MGLVLVTQSLGLGLASVLAAAAVDALRGHNAHVLVASLPSTMAPVGHSSTHFLQKVHRSGLIAYIVRYLQ